MVKFKHQNSDLELFCFLKFIMCVVVCVFRVRRDRPAWSTFRPGTCSPRKSWSKKTTLYRSVSLARPITSAFSHAEIRLVSFSNFIIAVIKYNNSNKGTIMNYNSNNMILVSGSTHLRLQRKWVTDVKVKRAKLIKRTEQWHDTAGTTRHRNKSGRTWLLFNDCIKEWV